MNSYILWPNSISVLLLLTLPILAHAQDARLLPGCPPAFAAFCPAPPADEDGAAPDMLPPPQEPPLFTPEIVAKDTPPEMLALFNAPTMANVDAYLAAQAARVDRMRLVERLIKTRTQERGTR